MIESFVGTLHDIRLEPTPEELADALWLASYLDLETSEQTHNTPVPIKSRDGENSDARHLAHPPDSPLQDDEPTPQMRPDNTTSLHVKNPDDSSNGRGRGRGGSRLFRAPKVSMLPDALNLGRMLRPFMQRIPSHTRFVLDEDATVRHFAESKIAWPVLRGEPERWFDIALIIEQSPSMLVWQSTLQSFRHLLKQHGAFRDVRTWRLQPNAEGDFELYPGLTGNFGPSQPQDVLANHQNRLVLVISDCKSEPWYNGDILRFLECWQQKHLVTLAHMLPQNLWEYCALRESPATELYTSGQPAPMNNQLKYSQGLNGHSVGSIKLPVIHLEARSIGQWAKMVTGKSTATLPGVLLKANEYGELAEPIEFKTGKFPKTSSVKTLTDHFAQTASKNAQLLAAYLAVVPLTMPVIRLVQQTMLPRSGQLELAEIFLSGLLIEHPLDSDPELMEYDFHVGVREVLLNSIKPSEEKFLIKMVSDFIKSRFGQASDFQVLLSDPTDIDGIMLDQSKRPLAEVDAKALRRFGDDYKKAARRIENSNKVVLDNSLDEQSRFNWRNIKSLKEGFSEIKQTLKNKLTDDEAPTTEKEQEESARLFKVMEVVSQRLKRIEEVQSHHDKKLHGLREFPSHVVEFEAELARIDAERYQRRVDLEDYTIYRDMAEISVFQDELEKIGLSKRQPKPSVSQAPPTQELDPELVAELARMKDAPEDTVPMSEPADSQDFLRDDNTEVEKLEAELEAIRRQQVDSDDMEKFRQEMDGKTSGDAPSVEPGHAYIICVMFNEHAPHEWSDTSGGGWQKQGNGTMFTEPAEVQICLRRLKKRWPSYPLKVVQR